MTLKSFRRQKLTAFALTLPLLLTACFESKSDNSSSSGDVKQGQFIESAVGGLRYVTPSREGITAIDKGTFEYLEGESVSFYLGELLLGQVEGKNIVSPFDLVGIEPLTGDALYPALLNTEQLTPMQKVLGIATLLQTLDRDNNLENGIDIPTHISAMFTENSLDFTADIKNLKHSQNLSSY
ncbi:hypothetical protein ACFOND_02550 [Reinekea marina]|uniref:Uncharacterized protein n=2 Tax=Reinekea marina TaxID=1310421 RepID=A0ABV7WPP3_9GAMM